ncbi:MAG: ABC transporter ATP-binding protein [Candidatus Bathyarchaeota archaeon]|nr:ABC transporter ATP-binding protein [Candidatus Bathyarchaeota archaeon]
MKTILKLENVRKTYLMGEVLVPALRGVNFEVYEKDFVAIFGPSGSGKTTFLNIIGLLDRPTEGKTYVDGSNILKLNDSELAELRLKKFGFVFQTFQLVPWLTALQNVEIPLTIAGVTVDEREQKAIELLRLVGLADRMTHRPLELSGGEQQRVAIARALVNDPEIILADEPTGNLDSKTGMEIIFLLKRLNDERGATIVVVTHDKDIVDKVKRIVYLMDGAIIKEEVKA